MNIIMSYLRGTVCSNDKPLPYICVVSIFALFICFYYYVNKTKNKYSLN